MKVEPQMRTVTRRKGRSAQISRSHNHQQLVKYDGKQQTDLEVSGRTNREAFKRKNKIRFSLQRKIFNA